VSVKERIIPLFLVILFSGIGLFLVFKVSDLNDQAAVMRACMKTVTEGCPKPPFTEERISNLKGTAVALGGVGALVAFALLGSAAWLIDLPRFLRKL
jgi:hypothetical protein